MPEPMLPVIDQRGDALTLLDPHFDETALPAATGVDVPCPLSLVVVSRGDRVLFGRNRWRGMLELPGGMRDGEETARDAAARELAEETGLVVKPETLEYVGAARFALHGPERDEFAAVYVSDATGEPQAVDGELTELMWWHCAEIPADMALLDATIARWTVANR